ncbi:hypothetical protein GQX74_010005 [Glossina fuscipes]|nr:hypothetical protein GQX74_010005 [Glossina fuscipes]
MEDLVILLPGKSMFISGFVSDISQGDINCHIKTKWDQGNEVDPIECTQCIWFKNEFSAEYNEVFLKIASLKLDWVRKPSHNSNEIKLFAYAVNLIRPNFLIISRNCKLKPEKLIFCVILNFNIQYNQALSEQN